MWRSTIRTVDPLALASHAGWTTALRAQRSGSFSWWQRGDIAIPVEMTHGTIVPCADTWARNGGGAYLCRNSLISVDRSGVVEWISSGNGEGLAGGTAIPGDATGRWFWPAGGFPVAATDLMVFGSMYSPGGLFGTLVGPYMAKISGITDTHPTDPVPAATGLDTTIHWGNPALFEDVVHIAGFKAVSAFEWHHYLARHVVATTAAGYSSSSGWTVTELTLDVDSPLTSLRLMPWRNGWLATAKILPSAPELGYVETPEVSAWWSEAVTGPYAHLDDLASDTTKPNWFSYAAGAVFLQSAGFGVSWSRNADLTVPGYTVDDYGPVFAAARIPTFAELEAAG
jgi:hypothetical protein